MKTWLIIIGLLTSVVTLAQKQKSTSFRVVPLGVKGGIVENNLSCYMVAPAGTNDYICFDAGTVYAGIEKAIANKAFKGEASHILKRYIKGYFISHAHLDHNAGLIIVSPDDSSKTIYALPKTMRMLEDYYFNGDAWANFGDEGKSFLIKKYHFESLKESVEAPVSNTAMHVAAYPLSHVNPYESTAFLLRNKEDRVLYLGDCGSDETEKSDKMKKLWEAIAPFIARGQLKGIFIEVSYPNDQLDSKLYGHLTPKWLMQEMNVLASLAGEKNMKNLPVVITHTKPPASREKQLKVELLQYNPLGLRFIFPQQGQAFTL